jgi:excisionase family DNA binding protein
MSSPLPVLHTVEEAAKYLQIGRSTLYRLVRLGKVPYRVLENGQTRFTDQDIADIDRARALALRPVKVYRPSEAA